MTHRPARLLATWLGCGLSPVAPGTVGSLGAIPLHLLLRSVSPLAHVTAIAGVTAIGVWAAQKVADELGIEDPSLVVIDEVAGALIAMGMVRGSLVREAVALALFRVFDIAKPGPVGSAEHMKPAGVGIMADDVVAGLMAGVLTRWVR